MSKDGDNSLYPIVVLNQLRHVMSRYDACEGTWNVLSCVSTAEISQKGGVVTTQFTISPHG